MLIGVLSTGVHFAVLYVLAGLLAVNAVWASSLGYLAGGMVNYVLNYHSAFRSNVPHRIAVSRFVAVAAVGFLANGLLIQLLVASVGLHYLLGQMVATLIVLVWNFLPNRRWTFNTQKWDNRAGSGRGKIIQP